MVAPTEVQSSSAASSQPKQKKAVVPILPDDQPLPLRLKEKLFTKEDHYHKHKILGLLCLASHAWRLTRSTESDLGFASHPHLTIPTVFLHLALHISSFDFVIPQRRIKDGGRIWPEYRLHALIFFGRSFAGILVRRYLQSMGQQDKPNYEVNLLIVLATMAAADLTSFYMGEHHSSSIQQAELPLFVKYMFSLAQFGATAYTLCSQAFAPVWYFAFVVQLNPFGMTLVRKNIISHRTNMMFYGIQLFSARNSCFIRPAFREFPVVGDGPFGILLGLAAWWRMGPWPKAFRPLQNKYLIWTTMYWLYTRCMKPLLEQDPYLPGTTQLTPVSLCLGNLHHFLIGSFICHAVYKQYLSDPETFQAMISTFLRGTNEKKKCH